MNKNIFRIALTGGPCAGKTTALARIIEQFSDLGYIVYALPETPTIFINASINFGTPDRQYFYNIEKAVLRYQTQMEDTFLELARNAPQPVIIVSDRGTMDISTYMDPMVWQAMLDELGLSEVKLRDARYDAVIHLVTAAKGAEEFYTQVNGDARAPRVEGLELARELDNKILKAWTGHPSMHIVENNVDFDVKIERVLHTIKNVLSDGGEDTPSTEQRRKFLVKVIGEIPYRVETDLFQTYIDNEDGSSTRLRKRGLRGNYVYFVSHKNAFVEGKSIITERQISPDEYISYLNRAGQTEQVHRTRKSFIWARQYFELDEFVSPKMEHFLLEVKTEQGAEVKLPPFLELIEEVTDNPQYYRL